jgi:hypothetical protein
MLYKAKVAVCSEIRTKHSMQSEHHVEFLNVKPYGRLYLKCDGTRAETRFRLPANRTSPFKSAGTSVQSTNCKRAVHINLQGFYCSCKPVFCSRVTLIGYPLHSHVSPSLLLSCCTLCHHISTGLYVKKPLVLKSFNPFRAYIGPRPTVWISSFALMSEDVRHGFCCFCSPAAGACPTLFLM